MSDEISDNKFIFNSVTLIGIGHIGSSLARAIRKKTGLVKRISATDVDPITLKKAIELKLVDNVVTDLGEAVTSADCVILCTPIGSYGKIMEVISRHLKSGCIVSDVGSVKEGPINDILPYIPSDVHLVPGHPIAGTEHSGPESGFAELFEGRYWLLTPLAGTDPKATLKMRRLCEGIGAMVEEMDADYHDKVLAITSHVPHLIAYTIVGTADDLEDQTQADVIRFSASGFRDFTRIAGSNPIMWRDIFLNNREAVLEMLQRFSEDLTMLQRAIRWGEGEKLERLFTRTREIRRGVIDARQEVPPSAEKTR
ncbi:MAG: cyclohexadienyl dehydrogenase [Rhodospirillaceae bacterium]|nr:cyclohexadienyl dehydrogenase [Rhodospirillaceae bacterium]